MNRVDLIVKPRASGLMYEEWKCNRTEIGLLVSGSSHWLSTDQLAVVVEEADGLSAVIDSHSNVLAALRLLQIQAAQVFPQGHHWLGDHQNDSLTTLLNLRCVLEL